MDSGGWGLQFRVKSCAVHETACGHSGTYDFAIE